jgi:hypothetical protein
MSDNFDYRQWMLDNRMGPYSKDTLKKGNLNESIEEEAIEEAPVPPAPEDVYDSTEEDEYDRGWDLAGPQIKSAIDNLRSSGYGDEDIMNFFRTALENYDQAFSGFSTGEDSEEEQGVMESGFAEETNEAYRGYHVNRKSPVPGRPGLYQDDEGNYFNSRGQDTDSEGNVISDRGSSGSYPKPRSAGEQEYDRLDRQFRISGLIPKTKNANHFVNAVNKFFRNKAEKMNTTPYQMSPSTIAYAKQEYERYSKKDSSTPPPPANP